jgi:hypothetical protein
MAKNAFSKFGRLAVSLPFTPGRVFYVCPSGDAWSADMKNWWGGDEDGFDRVYTDIPTAYAATTSGQNDVIVLDSNSSHVLPSMLTVSNNRVHFISMDWLLGVRRIQDQRTKVTMALSSGSSNVAMIRTTGNGCSFQGVKMMNSSTVTQSTTTFQDESPDGLLVENCSIQSLGSAQLTSASGSALHLAGDTSEYRDCQIGDDTVIQTVAGKVIDISTINGAVARRSVFRNCIVRTWASPAQTTHVFVKVNANGDIDREVLFKNCTFENFNNSTGATLAVGVQSNLTDSGFLDLDTCAFMGVSKVATSAVGNTNVRMVGIVSGANTSSIALTPTT